MPYQPQELLGPLQMRLSVTYRIRHRIQVRMFQNKKRDLADSLLIPSGLRRIHRDHLYDLSDIHGVPIPFGWGYYILSVILQMLLVCKHRFYYYLYGF